MEDDEENPLMKTPTEGHEEWNGPPFGIGSGKNSKWSAILLAIGALAVIALVTLVLNWDLFLSVIPK